MVYSGSAFFDDDAIFKTYMARRQRENNPWEGTSSNIIELWRIISSVYNALVFWWKAYVRQNLYMSSLRMMLILINGANEYHFF